jgi:hypothetical protein
MVSGGRAAPAGATGSAADGEGSGAPASVRARSSESGPGPGPGPGPGLGSAPLFPSASASAAVCVSASASVCSSTDPEATSPSRRQRSASAAGAAPFAATASTCALMPSTPLQQQFDQGRLRRQAAVAQRPEHVFQPVCGLADAVELEHPRRALDGMGRPKQGVDRLGVRRVGKRRDVGLEPLQLIARLADEARDELVQVQRHGRPQSSERELRRGAYGRAGAGPRWAAGAAAGPPAGAPRTLQQAQRDAVLASRLLRGVGLSVQIGELQSGRPAIRAGIDGAAQVTDGGGQVVGQPGDAPEHGERVRRPGIIGQRPPASAPAACASPQLQVQQGAQRQGSHRARLGEQGQGASNRSAGQPQRLIVAGVLGRVGGALGCTSAMVRGPLESDNAATPGDGDALPRGPPTGGRGTAALKVAHSGCRAPHPSRRYGEARGAARAAGMITVAYISRAPDTRCPGAHASR